MPNQLAQQIHPVITDETIEANADREINRLDLNFTLDELSDSLVTISDLEDSLLWGVGDLLVFGRLRMDKGLVLATPIENGNDRELYTAATQWGQDKYGPQKRLGPTLYIVSWRVDVYPSYWILSSQHDVRIWQTRKDNIMEQGFNEWLQHTAKFCRASWQTLANRYRTSATWPRPWPDMPTMGRRYDKPWSVHYEIMNLVGGGVDLTSRGIDSMAQKHASVTQIANELDEDDNLNLAAVLKLKAAKQLEVRGYEFVPPVTDGVYIKDAATKNIYQAVVFSELGEDKEFDEEIFYCQVLMQRCAGVFRGSQNLLNVYLKDKNVMLEDGRLIGWLVNQDVPSVLKASLQLAVTMNWIVD